MNLKFYPYTIRLKEEFTISINSRKTTPAIMVEIEKDGITGFGEASLPPYLPENQKSVIEFLKKVNLSKFQGVTDINVILDYVDSIDSGNNAAKASIDIALHDLIGKIRNLPLNEYLNIEKRKDIYTSFTFGISDEVTIKHKIAEAQDYKYLKIKLGTEKDRSIIELINSITDKPLFVDVNQGWQDEQLALDMINWLSEMNVILVEQPLPKEKIKIMKWLKERSPLPIIADEAVKNLDDLELIKEAYSGINIKLMKSGGIRQALKLVQRAKELDIKIMIGCMIETSCAISAASHLSPLADWVDLDGAELISNDLFVGAKIQKGKVVIPEFPGIGVEIISK
jgi:L-alanine-DL-glutamate epimerase-like enolase superfamily enzyme